MFTVRLLSTYRVLNFVSSFPLPCKGAGCGREVKKRVNASFCGAVSLCHNYVRATLGTAWDAKLFLKLFDNLLHLQSAFFKICVGPKLRIQ